MTEMSARIAKARQAGYSDDDIAAALGKDPAFGPKISQARQAGYKPAEIISRLGEGGPKKLTAGQNVVGFMSKVNAAVPLADEIAAGIKTGANALTGKVKLGSNPVEAAGALAKDFGKSMGEQRSYERTYDERAPMAANLATGTGNALTMLVPGGKAAQTLAAAPRAVNAARGAVVAGLTGAGYAAADRGTVSERLTAASNAVRDPVTLALGAGAGMLAPARKSLKQKPRINQDVVNLRADKIDVTPGQAAGGFWKALEDAGTSFPIVGPAIQEARLKNLGTLSTAVGNRALKPIGKRVPDSVAPGTETVAYVGKELGNQYDRLIPTGGVKFDDKFGPSITSLDDFTATMDESSIRKFQKIVKVSFLDHFKDGALNGPAYQTAHSKLRKEIERFSKSSGPDDIATVNGLTFLQEQLREAAARQNPKFAAMKAKVDRGYAEFKRLQAASTSTNAAADGVFSAGQYGGAIKKADKSLDKGRYAKGEAMGQDLARSAGRVLPSSVPDSGTATRGSVVALASAPNAVLAGLMAGGIPGALAAAGGIATTVGGLKLASKAYTPQAISAFNRALDNRISASQAKAALKQLADLAAKDPKVAPLYREASARLARSAGAVSSNAKQQNALTRANP